MSVWTTWLAEVGPALAQHPVPTPPPVVIPNPPPGLPAEVQGQGATFIALLKGVLIFVATGSFIACAILIGIGFRHRRQTSQEGLFGVGWTLLSLLVGGLAATLTGMLPVR